LAGLDKTKEKEEVQQIKDNVSVSSEETGGLDLKGNVHNMRNAKRGEHWAVIQYKK
jgi:hypothetical protein